MTIRKLDTSSTEVSGALQDWGTVGLPLSEPACTLRGEKAVLPLDGQPEMGIWECAPGHYRRQVRSAETMHILSGSAVFTPDGGAPVALREGDVYFFPAETTGVWDIQSTMRKVYVLFSPH
jgi:uncharacterized cupin superfamily protein